MLIDRTLDGTAKKNKAVVGFELGNDYSQMSFCGQDQSMPDTFSAVLGEEHYNIPTVLCRGTAGGKDAGWSAGKEAVRAAREGKGVLVGDLVLSARERAGVKAGEEEFPAEELLGIFVRKTLDLLLSSGVAEDIAAVAFTMRDMDAGMMEILRGIMGKSGISVCFLSHEDCLFQYIIHQPEEMWIHDVLLYDYRRDGIWSYILQMNRKTNPVACFIEAARHPQMKAPDLQDRAEAAKDVCYRQLDAAFLEIVRKSCDQRTVTSVFLLGDFFTRDWCRDSLKYMCRGRRVFQGNNLFSKGACYGARERVFPSTLSNSYVYLSGDKLRANIGMACDRGRSEVYYPILDAGMNWYEARKSFDVILAKNNTITLNISPLNGSRPRVARISLEGLKVRGNKTNRVGIRFYMEDANAVQIEITDKGFGEFFPSTGQVWRECLPLEAIT